jgi:hypothetical protein
MRPAPAAGASVSISEVGSLSSGIHLGIPAAQPKLLECRARKRRPHNDITPAICLTLWPVGIVPGFASASVPCEPLSILAAYTAADLRRSLYSEWFDEAGAEMYIWNAGVTGAFHETLGACEVIMRNAMNR